MLGLLRAANAERLAAPGGHVAGRIDRRGGGSLPLRPRAPAPGPALLASETASHAHAAPPAELKVLYRVTRARREDWGDDHAAAEHADEAVGCFLLPLDELYIATASARPCPWQFAATEAVVTPPGAPVQGLAGSPGWI